MKEFVQVKIFVVPVYVKLQHIQVFNINTFANVMMEVIDFHHVQQQQQLQQQRQ